MTTVYEATVARVGADAQDLIDAGVVILFGEPCPEALAEVSVVHTGGTAAADLAPMPGDVIVLGASQLTVSAAGELAGNNLRELGHVVLYCDPADDQTLLPGAVFVEGTPGALAEGDRVAIERAD